MLLAKIIDDVAAAHGVVNEIRVVIQPQQPSPTQAILQLKNHFLAIGKALQGVNGRTPLDTLRGNGPDVFKRTATHLVKFNISWADTLATMEALAVSGKLKLDADQRSLAAYLLKAEVYNISTAYPTV